MVPLKWAWPAIVALASLPPVWAAPDTPSDDTLRWRERIERVGEFPRGHADIVRWESRHLPAEVPSAGQAAPLPVDEAVRLALGQHPELLGPADPNPVRAREQDLARLTLAFRTRQAWLDAVLMGESLRLQKARSEVAEVGAELGQRMVNAGNWSLARGLREQITQARERLALLQAQQAERSARETLARLIGAADGRAPADLAGRLPPRLPEAPSAVAEPMPSDPEALVLEADTALAQQRIEAERLRPSVSAARLAQQQRAAEQALAVLVGPGGPAARPGLSGPPSMPRDPAAAEVVEAQAAWQRNTAERRSQAREAWGRLQDQHAMARETASVLLPLLTAQQQETQLRYNGMLQSTWDLLEATRERLAATRDAAQARHGYWSALLDWQLLSAGGPHRASDNTSSTPSATDGAPAKDH
ncbi:TolC family protein [Hydrogenophaga sp. MI9]|uniref:TolC family protein n=1 Tax=Hydrogenophaga sp. MI9 TaxID=3453719 RepID=UPI003EEF42DA